jgi:DNA repair exonuclease SbcCD ATPase subunit
VNVVAVPVALVGEVEDLIVEARDFVFAEDDFEAKLAHEHFQRYCAEHLKSQAEANVSAQAKSILIQACAAETDLWDRREQQRDQELDVLGAALSLLRSAAERSASFLQVTATHRRSGLRALRGINATAAEQRAVCAADLSQLEKLRIAVGKKVNQTASAAEEVATQLDTSHGNVSMIKAGARRMIARIKAWEQSYTAQEQQFSAEEQTHAAAARAVAEALEMLQSYYAQRPLDILDFDTELRPQHSWPADLEARWPDAPNRPRPYSFHRALGSRIVTALQTLARDMNAEVTASRRASAAVGEGGQRVRGFRASAAHETLEKLQKLRDSIREADSARVLLQDRLHTEQEQLETVMKKLAELQAICRKVTGMLAKPDVTVS